jgi:uridine phosphorylase
MNANAADFEGNHGIGRYVFLPGSDGRAKEIAEHFKDLTIKPHSRSHNLYMGTISAEGKTIDVAAIASGMGCPSTEIILHELYHLGAKRFLRVGTAGSLQPETLRTGALVNVQAAVRDESTTTRYVPIEFPAIASFEVFSSIILAAEKLGLSSLLQTGIVHTKSALYAREFGEGPLGAENKAYMAQLAQMGVLASEMEASTLFIQTQVYNHQLRQQGDTLSHRVLAGAILTIVGPTGTFEDTPVTSSNIRNTIELALETVKTLAVQEQVG